MYKQVGGNLSLPVKGENDRHVENHGSRVGRRKACRHAGSMAVSRHVAYEVKWLWAVFLHRAFLRTLACHYYYGKDVVINNSFSWFAACVPVS